MTIMAPPPAPKKKHPPRVKSIAGTTRVFSFGAKAPIEGEKLVTEQMFLMNRYWNRLVEIDQAQRAKMEAILIAHSPEIGKIDAEILACEERIEKARGTLRKSNADEHLRNLLVSPPPPELPIPEPAAVKAALKEIYASLRTLRARRKELRTAAFADESVKAKIKLENDQSYADVRTARGACKLYWANYLLVEAAMDAAKKPKKGKLFFPPKFHRWTGEGRIGVQIQGGMSVADVMGNRDPRLRIHRDASQPANWRTVRLRVGSVGRAPVWASFPAEFGSELRLARKAERKQERFVPRMADEDEVKWATITKRRVGNHHEWRLILTVVRKAGWTRPDAALGGTVGVDLGWRKMPGGLRVGYWVGSDGGKGELTLPDLLVGQWGHAEAIRSKRDLNFNICRDRFADEMDRLKQPDFPVWLAERTKTIRSWRSPGKLAALYWKFEEKWKEDRELLAFLGTPRNHCLMPRINEWAWDDSQDAIANLQAWRRWDARNWDVEASVREGAIAARLDIFRNFAAMLRRRYAAAIIEDTNWADMQELPEAEDDDGTDYARGYQRIAAVGLLAQTIRQSMTITRKAPAEYTSQKCSGCGNVEVFDPRQLHATCGKCGKIEDQDERAATNLLASADMVEVGAGDARGGGGE